MAAEQFIIDEFSTGIGIEWRGNRWYSAGYTHNYIHLTLKKIPQSVTEAINSKVFDASSTEGSLDDEPAILGRLVENWAVVVSITRAIDNTPDQRSLPVSRYFISQGGQPALLKIIDSIENYQAQNKGRMPVFDPYNREKNYLNNYNCSSTSFKPNKVSQDFIEKEYKTLIGSQSIPIILPDRNYNLKQLYILALRTSNEFKNQTVSWAYNVESLERPDAFLLIQPASQKAEENFKNSITRGISRVYREGVNDQKLKNKIEAVVNSSGRNNSMARLKTDLHEIENELNNIKLNLEDWYNIFNSLGAKKFPKNSQQFIHSETAKYLVLKSLIIPEEFPEFVIWYTEIKKESKVGKACSQFLQELKEAINPEEFPKLYEKLEIAVIKYSLANLI